MNEDPDIFERCSDLCSCGQLARICKNKREQFKWIYQIFLQMSDVFQV